MKNDLFDYELCYYLRNQLANNYYVNNSYNSLNIIDNNYYYYLYNINKLFKEKKYKSKIGAKAGPDSIMQTIIYYNPFNGTEKYIIEINNKFLINISVPLKNSNYFYNTTLYSIEDAFYYLKMHIY